MPIGPVTNSHKEISVVEPVSPALEHMKRMLFRPFDLGKWFTIGFCAWLAMLGESGGSGGGNFSNGFNNSHHNQNSAGESLRNFYGLARDFVSDNLYWIIPAAAAAIILMVALWLVILWLNSRGKFMFLHCVALDKSEVTEPWNKFVSEGNSLFKFRIALGLAGMILMLPLLAIIGVLIVQMCLHGEPDVAGIMTVVGLGLIFILAAILFALLHKFTTDFVVPIMFLRGKTCTAAWKEFFSLLSANAGRFALYVLFQIVLGMAIGMIVLFAILLTCCIAGCLMVIPYIGTVLLLPVLIFKRAYSLYFFAQFGPHYDVFPPAPPISPTNTSGLQPLSGAPL
jgi:hypothetical protein